MQSKAPRGETQCSQRRRLQWLPAPATAVATAVASHHRGELALNGWPILKTDTRPPSTPVFARQVGATVDLRRAARKWMQTDHVLANSMFGKWMQTDHHVVTDSNFPTSRGVPCDFEGVAVCSGSILFPAPKHTSDCALRGSPCKTRP